MDVEDIITLVLVFLLAIIPKKKKRKFETEPLDTPDVSEVRRRIEAMKRQRNANAPSSLSQEVPLKPKTSIKRNFSAYKHLHQQVIAEENALNEAIHLPEPKPAIIRKPVNNVQKNVAIKKTKLHEWIIGQVVLDTPAFRKNYGNFFNR